MKELIQKCPECKGNLHYKYAQYVDYLICDTCKKKFTESSFRKGQLFYTETDLFHFAYYNQKEPVEKTLIYFSGANPRKVNQAKKALNQSRLYKFADAYKFNIICVGIKHYFFMDGLDYTKVIKYLILEYNLKEENLILCGFSNGGIPTILSGPTFKFDKICFISPVLSSFTFEFCKKVKSEVIIIHNLRDYNFHESNLFLQEQLNQQKKKYRFIEVNTGHTSTKSFEKLVQVIF